MSGPPPVLPRQAAHSPGLYRATAFDIGAWLAANFPLGLLRILAGIAGTIYAWTHPKRVAVVEQNLRLIKDSVEPRTARAVYAEFGKTLADYFHIGTRSPEEAMRIIERIDGVEHLRAAHELGRGALIVTAHLGLFELGGLLLSQHGYKAVVLTYPEPSSALTNWRTRFRSRWGVETLEIGSDSFAFLQIGEKLRAGAFVATLIDRPHPTDSTPVRLPHGVAHFSAGILLLAAHGNVPVIPATMVRQANGLYHAQVFPAVWVQERVSRADTLHHHSQCIADVFTPVLGAHLKQWYQFVPAAAARVEAST